EILVYEGVTDPAEAVQAVFHVGGVAGLRHLAVVHDVHARPGLLAHHFLDRRAYARAERAGADWHALLFRIHHAHQVLRTRQAPRVRGEKALGAAFHGSARPIVVRYYAMPAAATRSEAALTSTAVETASR